MNKVNDLARVVSFESCDHPFPGASMELVLLGTGETVVWRMNTNTRSTADCVSPIAVGDVIALEASQKDGRLQRVRYSNKGRQFRGVNQTRGNRK